MAAFPSRQLPVVRRAKGEIEAGRLWKARDQLSGAVKTHPADQGVLDLLGEVHFRMGDAPTAWRYWFLTERDDEDARAAAVAFDEKFGGAELAATLRLFPAREPLDAYPAGVRERLAVLERQARDANIRWPRPEAGATASREPSGWAERRDAAIAFGGCLLITSPWFLGVAVILGWFAEGCAERL